MKIVFATGTYPPEISGQSTFVAGMRQCLSRHDVDSTVITYGVSQPDDISNGVQRISRGPWRHIVYMRALSAASRTVDLVYAQDLVSSGFPAALTHGATPLVVRIGGDFLWEKMVNAGRTTVPLRLYYQQPKSFTERIYLSMYRFVLRRATKVVFNTAWQEKLYQEAFGLSSAKTCVIENVAELTMAISASVQPKKEIIYAGRFVLLKNLVRLLDAYAQVHTDVRLVLIGDGPQRAELEVLAKRDARVEVLDSLGLHALWRRVSESTAVVVPSLTELNPNFALEALVMGTPVVVTREVGWTEALKSRCLLVDPLDTADIVQKITDVVSTVTQTRLRAQDRLPIAAPSWDEAAESHIKLFSAL